MIPKEQLDEVFGMYRMFTSDIVVPDYYFDFTVNNGEWMNNPKCWSDAIHYTLLRLEQELGAVLWLVDYEVKEWKDGLEYIDTDVSFDKVTVFLAFTMWEDLQ